MKERGILFSAPMVRALQDGSKAQTRRVANTGMYAIDPAIHGADVAERELRNLLTQCPYGQPGDRLWVREAWRADVSCDALPPREITPGSAIQWEADKGMCIYPLMTPGKLRPSMFMPRWASRITLEITSVRVERLQDISEGDAIAEGLSLERDGAWPAMWRMSPGSGDFHSTAVWAYRDLWQSINGAGSWDLNPWVWCVEFKKVTA